MTEVTAGPGLISTETTGYVNGHPIKLVELRLDTYAEVIDPQMIGAYSGSPGQVLGINEMGKACWQDPFNSDKELREKYPTLEDSWGTLMEALKEYELVKKLVQDHDK